MATTCKKVIWIVSVASTPCTVNLWAHGTVQYCAQCLQASDVASHVTRDVAEVENDPTLPAILLAMMHRVSLDENVENLPLLMIINYR